MFKLDTLINTIKTAARNITNSLQTSDEDKYVSAGTLAGLIGGAALGVTVASALWPVALLGGVAGSFVLAIGNWNGDFKSRALSAVIGFPLGIVFTPLIGGAMLGAYAGQQVVQKFRTSPAVAAQPEDTAATTPQPAANAALKNADLGASFDGPAAKGTTPAPAPVTASPQAQPPRTPGA